MTHEKESERSKIINNVVAVENAHAAQHEAASAQAEGSPPAAIPDASKTLGVASSPTGISEIQNDSAVVSMEHDDATKALVAFAADLHSYLRQNITWADTKAAFIFAAASAALAFLQSKRVTRDVVTGFWEFPQTLRTATGEICLGAFVIAVGATLLAVWPRLRGDATGLIYWKAVAKFATAISFAQAVRTKNDNELATERLTHGWELASICVRKFFWVDLATRALVIGYIGTIYYAVCWL